MSTEELNPCNMKKYLFPFVLCSLTSACNLFEVRNMNKSIAKTDTAVFLSDSLKPITFSNTHTDTLLAQDSSRPDNTKNKDTVLLPPSRKINIGNTHPDDVVRFAQTLTGTPYVYASTNPKVGFDCSGFITYVFNHFGIAVPRSSIDFTNVGKTVAIEKAKPGDLILFTGTDSTEKFIGHMGLVLSADSSALQFIHSSSGKAMGVTTTPLNAYYKKRFVRIARIFPQNDKGN